MNSRYHPVETHRGSGFWKALARLLAGLHAHR